MKTTILLVMCFFSSVRTSEPIKEDDSDVDSVPKELIRTDFIDVSDSTKHRQTRDLRIPFRPNRRPIETQVSPKPSSPPQASPRVFSHPKIRPEMSQPHQRHYHPAYSQGSLHRQSPRHHPRNQNERTPVRGPPRGQNHQMGPRQPMRQNDYMQDRRPFPPGMSSSGSFPPRHPSSPFSPIEDEIINSESQGHHTRSRIVDVYHHVPVRPNHDGYPRFSSPAPKTPIEVQSLQPYFKPPPPHSHFVSPRPTMIPQVFGSTRSTPSPLVFVPPPTTISPQVFVSFRPTSKPHHSSFPPRSSTTKIPRKNEFHVFDEMPEPPNLFTRKPIDLPVRLPGLPPMDRKPSFEFSTTPNIPSRIHHQKERPSIHTSHDSGKQSGSVGTDDSQSHGDYSSSTEKSEPDLTLDGKLRIVQPSDNRPTNGSGTVKKYWDFRQENGGLSVPLNAEPSIRKVVQSKPTVEDVSKFYHGLESVSSLPVRDNPIQVKNANTFSEESHFVKPHGVSHDAVVVKPEIPSTEFYQIGDKSHTAEEAPHFVHIEPIREKLPKRPQLNNPVRPKIVSPIPSTTTASPTTPKHLYTTDTSKDTGNESKQDQSDEGDNTESDIIALLDQELKYIPADIFRRNLTVSTGNVFSLHKNVQDPSREISPPSASEATTRIPVRPAAGLYARNRAQFEKFEDTLPTSSYEPSSEGNDSEPKQYFRGPQHVTNNWTILEDHYVSYGGPRRLISTSIQPNFNSLLLIPTTAMPHKYTTPTPSVHSHRKVINALQLAHKVFGRRNITRTFTISTTEKPEPKRFKFTYSPLPRPSTEESSDISDQSDSKQFFNFKTGTTHIVPQGSSSSETKIEAPGMHDDKRIRNGVNSPQYNPEKKFSSGTRPVNRLELLNQRRNNGTDGGKRLYYINLKPVTRPYVSSTSHVSSTSAVPRIKPSQSHEVHSSESSVDTDIDEIHPTTPMTIRMESTTEKSSIHILPTSHATAIPPMIPLNTSHLTKVKPIQNVEIITRVPIVEIVRSTSYAPRSTTPSLTTPRSYVRIPTTPRSSIQRIYTTPRLIIERIPTQPSTTQPTTSKPRTTHSSTTPSTTPTTERTTTQRSTTLRATTPKSTTLRTTTPSSTTTTTKSGIRIAGVARLPSIVKHVPTPPSTTRIEVITASVNQEEVVVESLKSMKVKMAETVSKGMRHLMPMVMELSSDVSVSSDCTFSLLRWLRGIRTFEQWAVKMMDASSKIPEGVLFGTMSTFGSFDECIAVKTPKRGSQVSYTGKYCSINIQPILPESEHHFTIQNAFRRYPKLKKTLQEMNIDEETMAYYYILKHRIGLCVPSTCSVEDVQNVTEKLADQLMMKISVSSCETSERRDLTRGQIISMSGVFIAFGIVVLGTIFDLMLRHRLDHDMDIEEIVRKKSSLRQFSYAFSAYRNACKILTTSIPTNHISAVHGIKFLSITWIMLGHVYYCKDYLTLAGLNRVRDLGSNLAFQVVLNSSYAADTFFFLSGLLVVYTTLQYLENTDGYFTIVGFYIKRYCRLTPAFLMISGVILLGPLAGSGPIWNETLNPFVSGCQNYWWTNLFYFSNFIPTDKTCVPHGWFLSCDMQFYLISPVIILALYRRPKMGLILITLGIVTSMATTGFLTFVYNLPPVSLFSLPKPSDINEYLDTMGYKPYAHYSAYCVGMATGFILAAKQKIVLSKCLQVFGWGFSITSCLLVVYGTWKWNSGDLPDWTISVAYATTSRTVWSMGIAWLTITCYAGYGGIINDILCWRGFIPLSRLTLLAYLIHPLLMYLYASYIRMPFYFSQYVMIYLYFGHLCVTFGLAFLFSLAFEVPFLNLEKIVSRKLDESRRKRRASFSHHHSNWQHPEYPEIKDSVVLMRRRTDRFIT